MHKYRRMCVLLIILLLTFNAVLIVKSNRAKYKTDLISDKINRFDKYSRGKRLTTFMNSPKGSPGLSIHCLCVQPSVSWMTKVRKPSLWSMSGKRGNR
jgi:hypothetical protein